MGSCFGKCWCSCCDCCFFSTQRSIPITGLSSSTSMLFPSIQNHSSPHHHVRSNSSAAACIFRSWRRRKGSMSSSRAKSAALLQQQQQAGFQLRQGISSHATGDDAKGTQSSIAFETLMCDFDIPEPTDTQMRDALQAVSGSSGTQLTSVLTHYNGHKSRVNPAGSSHIASVAYNRRMNEKIEFDPRILNHRNPAAAAAASFNPSTLLHHPPPTSSPHHHHHHRLHPRHRFASIDQSFPLLDPLFLSYTHETYLGNPTAATTSETSPSHNHQLRLRSASKQTSRSASLNGDAASLDGFEWDNYDETQIKPDDDDEDWYEDDVDSFSELFPKRNSARL